MTQINFYVLNGALGNNHYALNSWKEFNERAFRKCLEESFFGCEKPLRWLFGGDSLVNFRIWLVQDSLASKPLNEPYSQFHYPNGVKNDGLTYTNYKIYEYDGFKDNYIFLLGEGYDPSDPDIISKIVKSTGADIMKIKDLRNKTQDWSTGDSFSIELNGKELIYTICDDTNGDYHLLDMHDNTIHDISSAESANDLVKQVMKDWRIRIGNADVGTPVRVNTEIIVRRAKNEN